MKINFAEGCKLWSNDESGFSDAVATAKESDVAIVMVGTWSLDQTLLWTPGTNATTGEHVDLSDLSLVGAQFPLVQAIQATGTPTIVVFVSGKPVTNPWIQESKSSPDFKPDFSHPMADVAAVMQQFYPGELGGLAIAEVIFGAVNPSGMCVDIMQWVLLCSLLTIRQADSRCRSQQVSLRRPPSTTTSKGRDRSILALSTQTVPYILDTR